MYTGTDRSAKSEKKHLIFFMSENTQFANLGDVVLNHVLATQLRRCGQLVSVGRKVGLPPVLDAVFSEMCSHRVPTATALYQIVRSRLVGQQPILVLNPGGHRTIPVKTLLRVIFAGALAIPVVRIGVSIGVVERRTFLLHHIFERLCSVTLVRDGGSLHRARQRGNKNVNLAPDLAFLFPFPKDADCGVAEPGERLVGVSLRRVPDENKSAERHRKLLTFVLTRLSTAGFQQRWFAQVEEDLAEIPSACVDPVNLVSCAQSGEPKFGVLIADFYRSLTLCVTNRLHVAIFGMKLGVIPLMLVDSRRDLKIVEYFRTHGLDFLLFQEDWSQACIEIRIADIIRDSVKINSKLFDFVDQQQTELSSWFANFTSANFS